MDWMNQIGGLLQKYTGGRPQSHAEAAQDFDHVARNAPRSSLAEGLSAAFRSDQTPPFPQMLGQLFGRSNGSQRAGLLNHLLSAAPSFSGLLGGKRQLSPEEAERMDPKEVERAAGEAERQDPSIVDRASDFYAEHPALVKTLGAGALALLMARVAQRKSGAG